MMRNITYSQHTYETCKEEFISFRNANRDTMRDAAYFDWRYIKRPTSQKPIIIVAETEDGVIVGALSLIPHQYMINNAISAVGILGDISVAEEWRGQGIARKMFKYLAATEAARQLRLSLVLPNDEASRSLHKTNWQKLSTMERYVKLLNVEKKIRTIFRVSWLSKPVSLILNSILHVMSVEIYTGEISGYKGEVVSEFDDRFSDLWENVNKYGMIIGLRDKHYLTWRYSNHPFTNYQIYTLTHNSILSGYIVFHYQEDSCYIDDILFLNKNDCKRYLLITFLKYIRTTNIIQIIININKNDLYNLRLYRYCFLKRHSNWKSMIYVNDSSDRGLLLNGRKWYLTLGDKDT